MKLRFSTSVAAALAVAMPLGVSFAPALQAAPAKPATKPGASAKPTSAAKPAAPKTAEAKPAGVAAEVNNEKIMIADVNRMLEALKSRDVSLQTNSAAANKALQTLRDTIVDNLITQTLLAQEARKRNIAPPQAEVDKALNEFKQSLNLKTDAEFEKAMAREGVSTKDVRETIVEELAINELYKQLTADIVIKDADIGKFYRENIEEFKIPEMVSARHILIAVKKDAPQADRSKAKAKAEGLLKQAQAKGADFAKLAQANSDDPGSKNEGGNLGFFARGDMVAPFEEAAFKAQKGQVVGVVETQFGYHIIKVDDKKPAETVPLAEVSNMIRDYLLPIKSKERIDERLAAMRAAAKIKKYI